MTCAACTDVTERSDIPHVIRHCQACGREMHVHEPGAHGRGIQVRAGDRLVIPASFLQMSLNPLRSRGNLTRAGLQMLAEMFFLRGIPQSDDGYVDFASALEREMDAVVNAFPPLDGLDVNNPEHSEQLLTIMKEHEGTREFWALSSGMFLNITQRAIASGQAARAAWAAACAERSRSMMVFKDALEEVVWMGHSAKRVLDILGTWDGHRTDSDEEFWQLTFNENSYVLSQVFAVPMVFLQEKAYVGGMTLERSDSRFVDYLFSTESSREAILIEIKAPTTPLLGSSYRGNHPPSKDLAGSVVQVLNYRAELSRNLLSLTDKTGVRLNAFTPRCAIIIGNAGIELGDENARRSFELFRTALKDVEVITYDELFRKVEILAELFRLKRAPTKPA